MKKSQPVPIPRTSTTHFLSIKKPKQTKEDKEVEDIINQAQKDEVAKGLKK